MDAHTARCLGVSSGLPMSFNGHRSMIPNRSRYSASVQQQPAQPRQLPPQRPIRASSYDPFTTRSSPQSQVPQSYTPAPPSQSPFSRHNTIQSTNMAYPPLSTEFDMVCFSKGATSETTLNSDLWGDTFRLDTSGKSSAFDDFGLGLGSLSTDLTSSTVTSGDTEFFNLPELNTHMDPMSFRGSSPDGHTWSTLSESSGGMMSDFPDVAAESDLACLNNDFSLAYDSVLPSIEDNAPALPPPSLRKPSGSGVARSSPSHSYRTSPYPSTSTMSNTARSRSFTTGSLAVAVQRSSPFAFNAYQSPNFASQHASPLSYSTTNVAMSQQSDFSIFRKPETAMFDGLHFNDSSSSCPSHETPQRIAHSGFSIAAELDSNLPSSIAPKIQCEHQFAGSSEPPNLFGPLSEVPLSPPPEDFNCENEEDIPRVQDLRFEGDLYTPKYVRGHGNKREGWCGICKPGRWLVLKNSAFWYDKSFTHGISAATGAPFESPRETRRIKSNPDVWEGLCHSCEEWIALISSKKKGTTWFRHAYKCHTHQKVKDTPKRRREQSHAKATKAAQADKVKSESREDTPFSLDLALTFDERTTNHQSGLAEFDQYASMT